MNKGSVNVPTHLYKVVSEEAWRICQEAQELPRGANDSNFIHFSLPHQLDGVLKKHWNSKPYVILKIEIGKIFGRFVLEPNTSRTDEYYHLYDGAIPLSAVVEVTR